MSTRTIYEVRQRNPLDPNITRSLGFFTDAGMANQFIDTVYRQVYKVTMASDFVPDSWLTPELAQKAKNFNRWHADDKNSAFPIFFAVPHLIYNAIPAVSDNFVLSVSDVPFTLFDKVPS